MPNLTLLGKGRIAPVFLDQCRIRTVLGGTGGILSGQPYCQGTDGRTVVTTTAAGGTGGPLYQWRGLALNDAGRGQAVDGLTEGYTDAFDLSTIAYDAPIYLSDTPGMLSSTAGSASVVVGRVVALSDIDPAVWTPSKLLQLRVEILKTW